MENKHTPGPWSIVDGPVYGASRQTNVEALDQGKHGTVICTRTISAPDYRTEKCDEYIANMHLIAAAPELLDALERMIDKATRQNWNDNYPEELQAAFDARDKATGK